MDETLPVQEIKKLVKEYEEKIVSFLQDLVRIPSPSCKEKVVAERILQEMETLGYDNAWIDEIGNVIGRIGSAEAERNLLYDGHIDTVGIGDTGLWRFNPLSGEIADGHLWGRGAADNKNAVAVQVYGAFISKKIWGESLPFGIYTVGSVMEEDCDGLALEFAIKESIPTKISAVILGEPTNCRICRGHRGRVEICIETKGRSAHASEPELGDNAVYKMADIIKAVEELDQHLASDPFLGKGTIALTKIECDTDSLNCVPYGCRIYLDRRLTKGEDKELALAQLNTIAGVKDTKAEVRILQYDAISWTGKKVSAEKYFPTWTLPEDHSLVQGSAMAYRLLFNEDPVIDKWRFSTNGVATMGRLGIPTIGFGPGDEQFTHIADERIPLGHLPIATSFYAALPFALKF